MTNYIKQYSLATDTTLPVISQGSTLAIFNQGDVNTNKISLTITHMNGVMDLTGATISVVLQKPDGKVVYQDTTNGVTITDATHGKMDIMLNTQSRAVPGIVLGSVKITYPNNLVLETEKFSFEVEASIASDQAIASANSIPTLVLSVNGVTPDATGNVSIPTSGVTINDSSTTSTTQTWSANQINSQLTSVNSQLAESTQKLTNLWIDIKADYGAKGDNSTDDTTAIQNAITYANNNSTANKRITVNFPKGQYICSQPLVIGLYVDLQMDGILNYTGAMNSTPITIGNTSNVTMYGTYTIRVNNVTISDWVQPQSIGVKFINTYDCYITVRQATRFTIGVQLYAISNGNAYNEVHLDNIGQNKIGLNFYADNPGGWVNENVVIGGRFNQNAGVYAGTPRYGIQLEAYGIYQNESNTFIKPAIELLDSTAIPINIIKGRYNKFERVRNEGNGDTLMTVSGDSYYNYATSSYDYQGNYDPKITQSYYHNFVANDLQSVFRNRAFNSLINIDLYQNAYEYDNTSSTGYLKVKGMSYLANGTLTAFAPFLTDNGQKVQLSGTTNAIGVKVALGGITEFRVMGRRDFATDVVIVCYDGSGNVLTSGSDVISPDNSFGMTYSSTEYAVGAYFSQSTCNYAHYFKFGSNVASAFIGVRAAHSAPSGNALVRSFAIDYRFPNNEQVGSSPNVIYDTLQPGAGSPFVTRTGVPKYKYHAIGTFYADEKGVAKGYICTASGTPGTWVQL